MKELITYDRTAVGKRISQVRRSYGMTREETAAVIGRTIKHYADIERGNVGMSMETLLGIAGYFGLSLDYILLGDDSEQEMNGKPQNGEEQTAIDLLRHVPPGKRDDLLRLMELFIKASGRETGSLEKKEGSPK